MLIQLVTFQRTQDGPTEKGILINEGELIIDKNAKPVEPPLWNYNPKGHELTVAVDLGDL